MPRFGPVARPDLIRYLRLVGFDGPFSGGKHQFMVREGVTVRIPNPRRSDVSIELLARIIRQAGIDRADWERL